MAARPLAAILICLALGGAACEETQQSSLLPFYDSPDLTPRWSGEPGGGAPPAHTIPPFRFTGQNGESVTEATFEGKIYVACFFFTSCGGVCPKMTRNLLRVEEAFREDPGVLLLSHSVAPRVDTVPMLKSYARQYGVTDGKWHLVTGKQEEIYALARDAYFADASSDPVDEPGRFVHSEKLFLVDKSRRIRGVYDGTQPVDVEHLIQDIRTLRKEHRG